MNTTLREYIGEHRGIFFVDLIAQGHTTRPQVPFDQNVLVEKLQGIETVTEDAQPFDRSQCNELLDEYFLENGYEFRDRAHSFRSYARGDDVRLVQATPLGDADWRIDVYK